MEVVYIIKSLNTKAYVAYFMVLTCANIMEMKGISKCVFETRCKRKVKISNLISTRGFRGEGNGKLRIFW
jgi:hypothetical protein